MKKYLLSLLVFMAFISISDAANVKLKINHKLGTEVYENNKPARNNKGEMFQIKHFAYFLSDFTLVHDGGKRQVVTATFFLIFPEANPTLELIGNFNIEKLEAIEFGVGVNRPYNNEDPAKWSPEHPLAPRVPSMHWGWASGYRFVVMEGTGGEFVSTNYEFHALGNQNFYKNSLEIEVYPNNDGEFIVELDADYTGAVKDIPISQGIINHSDLGEVVDLLRNFQQNVFTPISSMSVENSNLSSNFVVFPNPSNGKFRITNSENSTLSVTNLKVYDLLGNLVFESDYSLSNPAEIALDTRGTFVVSLYDSEKLVGSHKIVVE